MPAGSNFLDIPCTIEYGTQKLNGYILQMNTTGMMVELNALPYRAGAIVNILIQFAPDEIMSQQVRAIKSYDNFFRTKPDPRQIPAPEPKRLSELHFLKIDEVSRQKIIKYLGRIQALQRQSK